MGKKILTILVVVLAFIVVILATMVFNQDGLNNSTTTSSSTTTRTTTTTTQKKVNAFDEIYEWLLQYGNPNDTHTRIVYAHRYGDVLLNVSYSTAFDDSIYFYMYFPDHNDNSLTLSYRLDRQDKDSNTAYWVELSSNSSGAFSENKYEFNKATFVRNSLVKLGAVTSSYNKNRFPKPYTEEEKEQGFQLQKEVDQIQYDCLLSFLDCLKYDFCERVGIDIEDLGFLKYE